MNFAFNQKLVISILTVLFIFAINFIIMFVYPSRPDEWYKKLKKAPIDPPSYVFGIVWSILYILIAISYIIAFNLLDYNYWIIPIIHLLLNFSYSPVFFYYKQLYGAAILTLLILIFALITMYIFSFKSKISVYLLIPYILWLIFANYLAWTIAIINNK